MQLNLAALKVQAAHRGAVHVVVALPSTHDHVVRHHARQSLHLWGMGMDARQVVHAVLQ